MKHFISLDKAKKMTALYRKEKDNVVGREHMEKKILSLSETFDVAAFRLVVNKPECAGVRIYFGMDDDLKVHSIIVGVNANNEDILIGSDVTANVLSTTNDTTDDGDTGIIEDGALCPPICPPPSPLNG